MKRELQIKTLDLAKRLLDHGVHPPTVYFPLIVDEALLIEPTETETKETLDGFVEVVAEILREAREDPTIAQNAPYTTPVRRLDEAAAARRPVVDAAVGALTDAARGGPRRGPAARSPDETRAPPGGGRDDCDGGCSGRAGARRSRPARGGSRARRGSGARGGDRARRAERASDALAGARALYASCRRHRRVEKVS